MGCSDLQWLVRDRDPGAELGNYITDQTKENGI